MWLPFHSIIRCLQDSGSPLFRRKGMRLAQMLALYGLRSRSTGSRDGVLPVAGLPSRHNKPRDTHSSVAAAQA